MRITLILRAQHLGFMTKKHWLVQGKRTIRESGARASLEAQGIQVYDAMDIAFPKSPKIDFNEIVGFLPKEQKLDSTHNYWNKQKCYMYGNTNVLVEGVPQAQVLTNTFEINELPDNLLKLSEKVNINDQTNKSILNAILSSHVFDAEQQKLPKKKLANRPAFNLPRDFGITDATKYRLLISKMLRECEKLAGRTTNAGKKILEDAFFVVPLKRDNDLIQMEINAETFVTSKKPLAPVSAEIDASNMELPKLFPIKCTISMPQENIYKIRNFYPISSGASFINPHTIILHYSSQDVFNLHRSEVTSSQLKSRSMLKAFSVAASSARAQYGPNVKQLPHPIVVQCIQTNGQFFHFGVFQLNTLDLSESTDIKNIWFNIEPMDLFSECLYKMGRPVLEGYNADVFKYFYAFYRNE